MSEKAYVRLREENRSIEVRISGKEKPDIDTKILKKWQKLIDTVAKIFNVPAGLIMKITNDRMQVFLTSNTDGNPYMVEASDVLGHGLYCETVIGTNDTLYVSDSLKSEVWKDNPDVKLNMVSYLGMPLRWPDGNVFGTICVLDSKERKYDEVYFDLLDQFKSMIETDLENEVQYYNIRNAENITDLHLKEIHHRIKNQFNIISTLVQLRSRESDEKTKSILNEVDTKLRSMALLHNKIYSSTNLDISITDYIYNVVKTAAEVNEAEIEIRTDFQTELDYSPSKMFDFGIVFSELVLNSIKYGVPDKRGIINLHTEKLEDPKGGYKVIYSDNGKGFSSEILNGNGRKGIGTLLIENFPLSFDGTLHLYNKDGAVTEFNIF